MRAFSWQNAGRRISPDEQMKTLESLVLEDEAWVLEYRTNVKTAAAKKYRAAAH
jgi:hypothetical protein